MIPTVTITFDDLEFYSYHGCLEQEKVVGNPYLVNIEMTLSDASGAIKNDDLTQTIDYSEAYSVIKEGMELPSKLLEHVCGKIAKKMFLKFELLDFIKIKLTKIAPPITGISGNVSVLLSVSRNKLNSL